MKVLLTALNSKYIHTNLAVRYLHEFSVQRGYPCQICEYTINQHLPGHPRRNLSPVSGCFDAFLLHLEHRDDARPCGRVPSVSALMLPSLPADRKSAIKASRS